MQLYLAALLISGLYLALLFGVAHFADARRSRGRSLAANPYVYSLSLAVYCTAWTFFGSVGRAAEAGLGFLPVYLGPTLIALTWWLLLRKIVRLAKANNFNSIADFISARYGNSTLLGALVTIAVVVGIMPYTALQLKAVSEAFDILGQAAGSGSAVAPRWLDSAFLVAIFMSLFGIMFGARHLSPSERHEGLVVAIAFESLVKLVAFLSVGVFITFVTFGGPANLFDRATAIPDLRQLFVLDATTPNAFASWFAITVFSATAVMFLPRQFHVAVVENVDERHIRKAMWLFPLYLWAINLFVFPLALAGLLTFGLTPRASDYYVLTLPLHFGAPALALFAFIGGLSAATAMLVVESVAISSMLVNNLIAPVAVKLSVSYDVSGWLLYGRRAGIIAVIMLGYLYYRLVGGSFTLVNLGLISFAAAFQFAPALIGGLYLRWLNRTGALTGLTLGFLVWVYTLVIPSLVQSNWLPADLLTAGPFGIRALRPTQLLGLEVLDLWSHALFWSVLLNVGGLVVGSVLGRTSLEERRQAERFTSEVDQTTTVAGALSSDLATEVQALLTNFVGASKAGGLVLQFKRRHGLPAEAPLPWTMHADLIAATERELAGSLGPASAKLVVDSYLEERQPQLDRIIDAFGEVSLSLEQSREDLSRRVRELSILYDASRRLSATLSLADLRSSVSAVLTGEFGLDGVNILVAQSRDDLESPVSAEALPPELYPAAQRAHRECRLIAVPEVTGDGASGSGNDAGVVDSLVAVPLLAGTAALGVMVAYTRHTRVYFTADFLRLLEVLAGQVGIALKNAQLYDELRLFNEVLDRKVRERTTELERANRQLRDSDRLKSEFLSVVAHEFRTPLTSICSFSEILLTYSDLEPTRATEFLQVINEESERLTRLINQVLDLSRIEFGKFELQRQRESVDDLIAAAFRVAQPMADRQCVSLKSSVATPIWVHADRDRLLQVLTNLLTNAIRFSPAGSEIQVGTAADERLVSITVRDHGPGVPETDHQVIFEKFGRAASGGGLAQDGTGLGLFIARQIVEHHGGQIWVENAPDGGAIFQFTIPVIAPLHRIPTRRPELTV